MASSVLGATLRALLGMLVAAAAWAYRTSRGCAAAMSIAYWRMLLFVKQAEAAMITDEDVADTASGKKADGKRGSKLVKLKLAKTPARVGLCLERSTLGEGDADTRALEKLAQKCASVMMWFADAGVRELVVFEGSGDMQKALPRITAHLRHMLHDPRGMGYLAFGQLAAVRSMQIFVGGSASPVEIVHNSSHQGRLDVVFIFSEHACLGGFPAWIARTPEILLFQMLQELIMITLADKLKAHLASVRVKWIAWENLKGNLYNSPESTVVDLDGKHHAAIAPRDMKTLRDIKNSILALKVDFSLSLCFERL
ncbi:Hypothetical Protein FCC1311_110451 [Hondaea fermentalgiana]|uniref:Uncharacterized protein n=1 Tax=Hondaea fermentalgiana TaxID=2315210 RepID=A0A2R5H2J2_9STRA|nr:Hypothetical Protein FCC1311_110451 [Hondaea fermentalgiana]|eukprot:GBG34614.1 Hypothetical Protein FCC1311_110451 [Hondaea fermentalgiana]